MLGSGYCTTSNPHQMWKEVSSCDVIHKMNWILMLANIELSNYLINIFSYFIFFEWSFRIREFKITVVCSYGSVATLMLIDLPSLYSSHISASKIFHRWLSFVVKGIEQPWLIEYVSQVELLNCAWPPSLKKTNPGTNPGEENIHSPVHVWGTQ